MAIYYEYAETYALFDTYLEPINGIYRSVYTDCSMADVTVCTFNPLLDSFPFAYTNVTIGEPEGGVHCSVPFHSYYLEIEENVGIWEFLVDNFIFHNEVEDTMHVETRLPGFEIYDEFLEDTIHAVDTYGSLFYVPHMPMEVATKTVVNPVKIPLMVAEMLVGHWTYSNALVTNVEFSDVAVGNKIFYVEVSTNIVMSSETEFGLVKHAFCQETMYVQDVLSMYYVFSVYLQSTMIHHDALTFGIARTATTNVQVTDVSFAAYCKTIIESLVASTQVSVNAVTSHNLEETMFTWTEASASKAYNAFLEDTMTVDTSIVIGYGCVIVDWLFTSQEVS